MQGINRNRHMQLVETLLELENRFAGIAEIDDLMAKRLELENSYAVYQQLLEALAFHIALYEDMFTDIKVNYVGNRLKELKQILSTNP